MDRFGEHSERRRAVSNHMQHKSSHANVYVYGTRVVWHISCSCAKRSMHKRQQIIGCKSATFSSYLIKMNDT